MCWPRILFGFVSDSVPSHRFSVHRIHNYFCIVCTCKRGEQRISIADLQLGKTSSDITVRVISSLFGLSVVELSFWNIVV